MTSAFGRARSLVDVDPAPPYTFVEHTVDSGHTTPYLRSDGQRSFLVVRGSIDLENVEAVGTARTMAIERLTGWHAPAGSVFRVHAPRGGAVLVEAGPRSSALTELTEVPSDAAPVDMVSDYTVSKPWGHEIWYSHNLTDPAYALKQIHMTAGHQSSLQSHRQKAETNYVVDGEAKVLNGLPAPDDLDAVIDVNLIPVRTHPPGTGWSSAPGILHRVIAQRDYTSIEVSTPELDDVIRWQDDSGRGHGRIETEHQGALR